MAAATAFDLWKTGPQFSSGELGMLAVVQFGLLVGGLQTVSSAPMFLVIGSLILINLVEFFDRTLKS